MGSFRRKIKEIHRDYDGIVGRVFGRYPSLRNFQKTSAINFDIDNFKNISYSRLTHFNQFEIMPVYKKQTPATCDLKVYQDLFVYNFIITNIPIGSKILEVGGGESRIISCLNNKYEFWNLDKLEGKGHGPRQTLKSDDHFLVQDYLGLFSEELPENYFDLIFSVSVFEHFPDDNENINNIILDCQRLLKNNAHSLHCVDSLLFDDHIWIHPLIYKLKSELTHGNFETNFERIYNDEDLWTLSKYAYYTRWFPITRKTIKKFGYPFSLNIYWQNIT